jgi:hypothetical protein
MSVRFFRPENPLGKALRGIGGIKVGEALSAAAENLKDLKAPAIAELQATLVETENLFATFGPTFDEEKLDGLYLVANQAIGLAALCGMPAVDDAVVSLCDLLDKLKTRKRWDAEAVGVHIHSLRALLNANPGDAQVQAILAGLRQVSAKYA